MYRKLLRSYDWLPCAPPHASYRARAERTNTATHSRFLFHPPLPVELKRKGEFWELFIRHYWLFWAPAWVRVSISSFMHRGSCWTASEEYGRQCLPWTIPRQNSIYSSSYIYIVFSWKIYKQNVNTTQFGLS